MEQKAFFWDEINPYCLIKVLLKNIWVIVLLCASVLLCYNAASRLTYKPQYTSTATFMVSAKDSTSAYNSLTTTQSMASVFVEVFQSNVLREKVRQQMPGEVFSGTIQTATIPETNLLTVSVTAGEPDTAFRALTLIVENYSSISDYVFSNAQLEVIKDPVVPFAPSNPLDVTAYRSMILFITAAIGVAAVVGIWLLKDTVQNSKAARRKIDARLMRVIGHEEKNKTLRSKLRRKNIAPLITNPLISKSFMEDNLSFCSALEYHMRKRGQQVVMVTSVGENEGKSTVVANLALALAEKGRKVVLLDCDFRKPSMHKIFESPVEPAKSLTGWLLNPEQETWKKELKKNDITIGLSQPAGKQIHRLLNNGRLQQLLQELRSSADYVILDTPPMLAAADAERLAAMADTAVLVARADFMPAMAINDGLDRLRKSAPEVCGFVLNNHNKRIL